MSVRFLTPIELSNFPSDTRIIKKQALEKNKSKQALKLAEVKGTQDLFRRLLFLSFQQKIDVSTMYQYPIVPEPHCFAYPNGALRDNSKSNACKIVKEMVNTEAPQNSNTVNADGMF